MYVVSMLLSLILLGVWGVASKMAGDRLLPVYAMLTDGCGHLVVVLLVWLWVELSGSTSSLDPLGVKYGVMTGLAGATSMLAFFAALRLGKASIVVPVTALYPVLVLLFGVFVLHERLSPREWSGVALAMVGLLMIVI